MKLEAPRFRQCHIGCLQRYLGGIYFCLDLITVLRWEKWVKCFEQHERFGARLDILSPMKICVSHDLALP